MSDTAPRIARLAHIAIIAVGDVDARSFLHAQLSRSLTNLPPSVAPLAGWHDARGRVRAVFRVVPTDERWLLLTSAATVQTILAKLRMFVLRARVTLAMADDLRVDALIGDARAWLEVQRIELAEPPNALARAHGIDWVRIGPDLIYALGTDDALRAAGRNLDEAPTELAELAELRCGIPRIDAALSEKYIAQMLNLDLLDAVSFDKGCYPGQEIIARTHHLGAVKRRLRRFAAAAGGVPAPGTELIGPGEEAAGEVVRAARAGAGIELLAVVRLDRAAGDLFVAGSHETLHELPLPYSS